MEFDQYFDRLREEVTSILQYPEKQISAMELFQLVYDCCNVSEQSHIDELVMGINRECSQHCKNVVNVGFHLISTTVGYSTEQGSPWHVRSRMEKVLEFNYLLESSL